MGAPHVRSVSRCFHFPSILSDSELRYASIVLRSSLSERLRLTKSATFGSQRLLKTASRRA